MPRFGGAPKCEVCGKSAYPQESSNYDQKVYHTTCFKCKECKRGLSPSSIAQIAGDLYCKNCFKRIFKTRGKYDDFGEHTQAKNKNKPKGGVGEFQGMKAEGKEDPDAGPGQAKLEDSNVAGLGSQADKDLRKEAAKTEPAWEFAGQKPGTQIWRIEKFKVVAWPEDQYGKFYTGDSYIILYTYHAINPEDGKPEEALSFDLHFWLGATTSQDEMGTAAYKTVELDDFLDQKPVQYREVQDHESERFLEIFGGNIFLMEGGVESGFRKVKPEEYKPRLLHCKGKKNIRVKQVPMEVASLNHGDAFLLDNGLTIYQWNGTGSGVREKNKARDIRLGLVDERNGRPKSEVIDGMDDNEGFWGLLGADGIPAKEDIADATGDDEKVEEFEKKLLQLSDASGEMVMTDIAKGDDVTMDKFKTDDVFIFDAGHTIFTWVGLGASKAERANGVKYATDYMAANGRPMHTPVVRVLEGGATIAFDKAIGGNLN